jgi:hypothetical protein
MVSGLHRFASGIARTRAVALDTHKPFILARS